MKDYVCRWCGAIGGNVKAPCFACVIENYGFVAPRWAITVRRKSRELFSIPRIKATFLVYCRLLIDSFVFTEDRINKLREQVEWEFKVIGTHRDRSDLQCGQLVKTNDPTAKRPADTNAKGKIFALIDRLKALTNNLCFYCSQDLGESRSFDTLLPVHISHSGDKAGVWLRLQFLRLLVDQNNARACCDRCNHYKGMAEKAGIFTLRSAWVGRSEFTVGPEHEFNFQSPPLFMKFTDTQFVFPVIAPQKEPGIKKAKPSEDPEENSNDDTMNRWLSTFALRVSCTMPLEARRQFLQVYYSPTVRGLLFTSKEHAESLPKKLNWCFLGTLEYIPRARDAADKKMLAGPEGDV